MSIQLMGEASAKFPIHSVQGTDYKAWAKRILYRHERGDNSLLAIQIQFAKMAMNVTEEKPA